MKPKEKLHPENTICTLQIRDNVRFTGSNKMKKLSSWNHLFLYDLFFVTETKYRVFSLTEQILIEFRVRPHFLLQPCAINSHSQIFYKKLGLPRCAVV